MRRPGWIETGTLLSLGLLLTSCACWNECGMPAAAHTFDGSNAAIRDVIARVAHHQIHTLADGDYTNTDSVAAAQAAMQAVGIEWNYPWGVTLYGMLHVSEATGDKEVERFVVEHNQIVVRYYDWMRDLRARVGATREMRRMVRASPVRRLLVLGSLDNCGAMGAQLAETFVNHGVQPMPEQKAVAEMIADYISNKQARLPDGTLWRPNALGGTIWVDDLYMSCPFLVRWYKYTGERRYLDDAARQIINMAQRLQDEDGVWWHGYYQKEDDHAPVKWGRGNGWAMVSTVEVLSAMPEDHPDRAKLLDILRRQVEGIKPLQASDGMWRQVLDQPELWEETSCTAMFSYAIARAVKRGWIDPYNLTVARKAFAAVARHVTPDGVVIGACQGTGIGEDLEAYVERARLDDDQHGPGPVMLAGAELLLVERR